MSVNIETENGLVRVSDLSIHQSTGAAEGDVLPQQVLEGKTFSSSAGKGLIGTMPNNEHWSTYPKTYEIIKIPRGYHNGSGVIDTRNMPSFKDKSITINLSGSHAANKKDRRGGVDASCHEGIIIYPGSSSVNGQIIISFDENGVPIINSNIVASIRADGVSGYNVETNSNVVQFSVKATKGV